MISDVELARMNWFQWMCWMTGLRTLWRNRPTVLSRAAYVAMLRNDARADSYWRQMWEERYKAADAWTKMLYIAERPDCSPEIREELKSVAEFMGWRRPEPGWVKATFVER
jgi:hypothetical protein